MKKLMFMLLALMAVSATLRAGDKITTTDPQKLPTAAREFISTHFPDAKISLIQIERETGRANTYDVKLEGGFELEFDGKGAWTEIDGGYKALPHSVLPQSIVDYVHKNYPDNHVSKIDRDRRGYDVKLTNGTELDFDAKGGFLRIDR